MLFNYKKVFIIPLLAFILIVPFFFSSVRGFAGDLLTIFRFEKVQTITVDPEDISQLEAAFNNGNGFVDIENFGKFEITGGNVELRNVSMEKARQMVDFTVKLPDPEGYAGPELGVTSGSTIKITLDTEKINQVLKSLGSGKLLPKELNGRTFSINVPTTVSAEYSSENSQGKKLLVAQSRSPELAVPEGTSVAAIRDALLAVPVLPENLRKQLAAVKDWQHTILIPNIEGSSTEVSVNGNSGVYFAANKSRNYSPALIWQEGGVIYCLTGNGMSLKQALSLANKME